LLTPTFLPKIGGVETVVASLARHYWRMSVRTCVVTQWPRRGKGTPADDQQPYPIFRYRRPWSFHFSLGMRTIHQALERAWRETGFDLIHCHLVYPAGYVATQFGQKHGVPVVITPHGSDVRPTCRYRQLPVIWERITSCLRQASRVTAINSHMHRLVQDILAGRTDRIAIIPNGVDIEELNAPTPHQDDWPVPYGQPFVLYLGGLTHKKGVDVLLRAMDRIRSEGRSDLRLVMAGDGPLRDQLQGYIRSRDLDASVNMVGLVCGEFKQWLLQNCRFLVMPSRTESMPLVALEAFACGKPILASGVGGLCELIADGRTGRLIPPDQPDRLARELIRFADGDYLLMAAAARAEAQRFDWPNIARDYLDLYRQILAAPHPAPAPVASAPSPAPRQSLPAVVDPSPLHTTWRSTDSRGRHPMSWE